MFFVTLEVKLRQERREGGHEERRQDLHYVCLMFSYVVVVCL